MNTSPTHPVPNRAARLAARLASAPGRLTVRDAVDSASIRLATSTNYCAEVCRRAAALIVVCGIDLADALALACEQNSMPVATWRTAPHPHLVGLIRRSLEGRA